MLLSDIANEMIKGIR